MLALPANALAVQDANLQVQMTTIPAQQTGSSYSGTVATSAQGGLSGDEAATIDWGDGTPVDTTATVSSVHCTQWVNSADSDCGQSPVAQALVGTVSGSHTFARPGPYTIKVHLSGTYMTVHFPSRVHTTDAQVTIPAAAGTCNILGSLGFAKMQTLNGGCITTNGTQQISDPGSPVKVDGLELDPAPGVSLTMDSATGKLT